MVAKVAHDREFLCCKTLIKIKKKPGIPGPEPGPGPDKKREKISKKNSGIAQP